MGSPSPVESRRGNDPYSVGSPQSWVPAFVECPTCPAVVERGAGFDLRQFHCSGLGASSNSSSSSHMRRAAHPSGVFALLAMTCHRLTRVAAQH